MIEQWKAIAGHEGLYQISNLGRVKRLQRIITTKNDKFWIHKEKILTGTIDGNGYIHVRLVCPWNGKLKLYKVHRLVGKHFYEDWNDNLEIHHIDHNKQNNKFQNLLFLTQDEHKEYHRKKDHRGVKNYIIPIRKSKRKIVCIQTGEEFYSIKEAAQRFNLTESAITYHLNRKTKLKRKKPCYHFTYKEI